MAIEDKNIVCADCGAEFVHSAADQQRYVERGFTNEPKRCPDCRARRKAQGDGGRSRGGSYSGGYGGGGGGGSRGARELYSAVCAECGQQTQVPFKPTEGRPVYCRDCFQSRRS